MAVQSHFQPHLFGAGTASVPTTGWSGVERRRLGRHSWLEHGLGWLPGADELFEALVAGAAWRQGRRRMYERTVDEPRLTSWYERGDPLPHPLLADLFPVLDHRYGRRFESIGLNLYRNGGDSVAWHGDRVQRGPAGAVVVIVSLGEARAFLLRPRGGGSSLSFALGRGDLLVMGGQCQHEFEHCVPKLARAGPRLSVTFRHGPLRGVPGRVSWAVEPPWSMAETRLRRRDRREPPSVREPFPRDLTPSTSGPGPGPLQEPGAASARRDRTKARPSSTVPMRPSSCAS